MTSVLLNRSEKGVLEISNLNKKRKKFVSFQVKERSRSASSLEAADLDFSVIEVILRDFGSSEVSPY